MIPTYFIDIFRMDLLISYGCVKWQSHKTKVERGMTRVEGVGAKGRRGFGCGSERGHCKWLEIRKRLQNWLPSSIGARNAKDNTWDRFERDSAHQLEDTRVEEGLWRLVTMLSRSGIGWNVTTNMIEAPDDAWAEYVKVDANARLMRNKSWPFYNDWVMIFGKDRATGNTEDFTDALNHVMNGQSNPQDDYHMSASGKKGAGGKRKSSDGVDPLYEIMRTFTKQNARLGDISKRIGYEYDVSIARKEVFGVVGNMQD
ncbi:hypothetical protein DH2020_037365 [Rehmannia glutinosa]|uniref:Myb/SANT-like domain-containing protein n=1 Tax=Rehmannia glutinosa TaxID=99300 RepID=A0ABR0V1K9_REHGL